MRLPFFLDAHAGLRRCAGFLWLAFKLKSGGTICIQHQSGIELLTRFAGQSFRNGGMPCEHQVSKIVFGEKRATYFTKNVEVATLAPALGYLGIDAYTLPHLGQR